MDPTVGTPVRALGYDRDFGEIVDGPVPGCHRVSLDLDPADLVTGPVPAGGYGGV